MAENTLLSKHVADVFSTMNYNRFKALEGNREEVEIRAGKIKSSVDAVGYVPAPIIVNEHYEIIDGQARFYYCKAAGLPIVYMVVPGLTIDHCVAMNINSTNWNVRDYIHSYAQRGFPAYCALERFFEESRYGFNETLWAVRKASIGGNERKMIISGELKAEDIDIETGRAILRFWENFDDIKTNNLAKFRIAAGYCYLFDSVDNQKLVAAAHKHPNSFTGITNISTALVRFEEAYNFGIRYEYRVDLTNELIKFIQGRFGDKTAAMMKAKIKEASR